jgi:hypothetical protein
MYHLILLTSGFKAFRLSHVDFFVQLAIEIGIADVYTNTIIILKCGQCKY